MTIRYVRIDMNSDGENDISIPIIDSGNGKDGKLSPEDWKRTLELNQTIIRLGAELYSVQDEIRSMGGEITSCKEGGWVGAVLKTLMTLAPMIPNVIEGGKKAIQWIKDKRNASGVQPSQDIDYTLNELRKAYKKL